MAVAPQRVRLPKAPSVRSTNHWLSILEAATLHAPATLSVRLTENIGYAEAPPALFALFLQLALNRKTRPSLLRTKTSSSDDLSID